MDDMDQLKDKFSVYRRLYDAGDTNRALAQLQKDVEPSQLDEEISARIGDPSIQGEARSIFAGHCLTLMRFDIASTFLAKYSDDGGSPQVSTIRQIAKQGPLGAGMVLMRFGHLLYRRLDHKTGLKCSAGAAEHFERAVAKAASPVQRLRAILGQAENEYWKARTLSQFKGPRPGHADDEIEATLDRNIERLTSAYALDVEGLKGGISLILAMTLGARAVLEWKRGHIERARSRIYRALYLLGASHVSLPVRDPNFAAMLQGLVIQVANDSVADENIRSSIRKEASRSITESTIDEIVENVVDWVPSAVTNRAHDRIRLAYLLVTAAKIEASYSKKEFAWAQYVAREAVRICDIQRHPFLYRARVQEACCLIKSITKESLEDENDKRKDEQAEKILQETNQALDESELGESQLSDTARIRIDPHSRALARGELLLARIWLNQRRKRWDECLADSRRLTGKDAELGQLRLPLRLQMEGALHVGLSLMRLEKGGEAELLEAREKAHTSGQRKIEVACCLGLAELFHTTKDKRAVEYWARSQALLGPRLSTFLSAWSDRLRQKIDLAIRIPLRKQNVAQSQVEFEEQLYSYYGQLIGPRRSIEEVAGSIGISRSQFFKKLREHNIPHYTPPKGKRTRRRRARGY